MPPEPWEFFDHAADVGIRVEGPSFPAMLLSAGRALMAWIGQAPDAPDAEPVEVRIEGESHEDLLIRWLQEILFRFHVDHLYFTHADPMQADDSHVTATLHGRPWGEAEVSHYHEVKAVTYHKLAVHGGAGSWRATIILDI